MNRRELEKQVERLIADVAALERELEYGKVYSLEKEFKYGRVTTLESDVKYLEKDRDKQRRTIAALCAQLGIDEYTLQLIGE